MIRVDLLHIVLYIGVIAYHIDISVVGAAGSLASPSPNPPVRNSTCTAINTTSPTPSFTGRNEYFAPYTVNEQYWSPLSIDVPAVSSPASPWCPRVTFRSSDAADFQPTIKSILLIVCFTGNVCPTSANKDVVDELCNDVSGSSTAFIGRGENETRVAIDFNTPLNQPNDNDQATTSYFAMLGTPESNKLSLNVQLIACSDILPVVQVDPSLWDVSGLRPKTNAFYTVRVPGPQNDRYYWFLRDKNDQVVLHWYRNDNGKYYVTYQEVLKDIAAVAAALHPSNGQTWGWVSDLESYQHNEFVLYRDGAQHINKNILARSGPGREGSDFMGGIISYSYYQVVLDALTGVQVIATTPGVPSPTPSYTPTPTRRPTPTHTHTPDPSPLHGGNNGSGISPVAIAGIAIGGGILLFVGIICYTRQRRHAHHHAMMVQQQGLHYQPVGGPVYQPYVPQGPQGQYPPPPPQQQQQQQQQQQGGYGGGYPPQGPPPAGYGQQV